MRLERRVVRCVALLAGLLVCACGGAQEPAVSIETDAPAETNAEVQQPYRNVPRGPGGPVGTVLEKLDAGGYTYARVKAADKEIWMAAPSTVLTVGDTVSLAGADNMGPFKSPSIDRTFDEIYFIDQFRNPHATVDTFRGTVIETMNVAGYTYALVKVGEEPAVWLAAPKTELGVGDAVSWGEGALMREFHSATLDRTFPEIVFVASLNRPD
jgi:hypothetical protein